MRVPRSALLCLMLLAGCLAPHDGPSIEVPLTIDIENSAGWDVETILWLDDGAPQTFAVPYDGSAPNVQRALETTVPSGPLDLRVHETQRGAWKNATFDLGPANWITVNVYDNGSIDVWWHGQEPLYD